MKSFKGEALRWDWREGVLELTLDRAPANEIGTAMLGELEAGQLGRSKLDELLVLRDQTTFDSSGDFGEGWPDYRWRSSGMMASLTTYEVTVTVEWVERGQPHSLAMTTLVYPPSTKTATTGTGATGGGQ